MRRWEAFHGGATLVLGALTLMAPVVSGLPATTHDALAEGDRLLRAALFDPAQQSYRRALASDAQSGAGHLGLARTLGASREWGAAREEAELAVHLLATPDALLTLAGLRERDGDSPGAVDVLDRFLAPGGGGEHPVRHQRARAQRDLLQLVGPAPLRGFHGDASVTVPIDVVQDKVLFKGSLNSRVPVDLVLDTGADQLVVSADAANRAGLRRTTGGAGRPQLALVESVDIGGLTVRRVPALVRAEPLRILANRSGETFSPLPLGLSMTVDYGRRELTLARRLPFEPADVELPLHILGLPVIVGRHHDTDVSFVVDTGADVSSVSTTIVGGARVDPAARRIPMRLFDAWGRRQTDAFLLTPGIDLSFGGIHLPAYPVVVRAWPDVEAVHGFEMGGILGHNFLRHHRVTIDLVRRVVRFRRLSQ